MKRLLLTLAVVVTLNLERVPVRHAIREIAEQAKVNIAVDTRIRGHVTAKLEEVDLEFALRAILGQVGATYRVEKDGLIHVVPVTRNRV